MGFLQRAGAGCRHQIASPVRAKSRLPVAASRFRSKTDIERLSASGDEPNESGQPPRRKLCCEPDKSLRKQPTPAKVAQIVRIN